MYVLDEERREELLPRIVQRSLELEGVDLAMWLVYDEHGMPAEAVVASAEHGELRFAPGDELDDPRGGRWTVEGSLAVLDGDAPDGRLQTSAYPDALARVWAALTCPTSGDVALSSGPAYEFLDWGGQGHVGGGSHGSLHASDSLGALIFCGVGPQRREEREQWTIGDVAPIAEAHFGVGAG